MRCFLTMCILYLYFNHETRGDVIAKYLAERMQFVKAELNRFQRHAAAANDDVHEQSQIDFGESRIVTLGNKSEAHTFSLFDRNYLLSDNELFFVGSQSNTYILTSLKQFTEMHDKIAFIKTMDYKGIGYMFVSFVHDMDSQIYRFVDNTLEPRVPIQTIKTLNKLTDATFFINDGFLYLVISSAMGVSMAPIIVYKWEESHFDDIDQEYVDGAIGLSHFPNMGSEIIIVLRNNELEASNSIVYEFKDNKLGKTQILDDTESTHILNFNYDNSTFLIIFNDAPASFLYRWINNEFVFVHTFEAEQNVQQVFLTNFKRTPLIATASKENIMIFTTISDTVRHLKSQHFDRNFTKVLNMKIGEYDGEKVIFLLGLTEDSHLNFIIIPMALSKIDIVNSIKETNDLDECMQYLEDFLEKNDDDEVTGSFTTHSEKFVNEETSAEVKANVDAVLRASQDIREEIPEDVLDFGQDFIRIQNDLIKLEEKSIMLQPQLRDLLAKNVVTVNGKLQIQGALNAETLNANSIRAKKLNGLNWSPESWLQNSGDQVITAPFFIEHLKVNDLQTSNDNQLFKDMLVTTGNQTLFGVMSVGSLKAFNIFAPQINDVQMPSVYLRSAPVKITGNKSFNNVNVDDIHMTTLNGKNASATIKLFGDPKAVQYEFLPLITVKNLEVETINDVNWKNFSESVFRIGSNQSINGNVTLSSMKVQHLQAAFIGGVNVSNLLTTSTDQTVDSVLHFQHVDASGIQAQRINQLDFAKDVATCRNGVTTLITGPVTIKNIHITGNLKITGSVNEFYKQNHIVGTHERDLLQIYNDKVKINGDLHLVNINMADTAKLFINGNEFNQDDFNEYWLKTTNQEILAHFEAQNGISTPHLNTKHLNDIHIDDYMVNNLANKKQTTYAFENVTIVGNVIIDKAKQHQPDLDRLNANAVKLNGTYVVRGAKQFDGKIAVENLKADSLNNVDAKEFLTQNANNIIGSKVIKNLTVRNANVNNLTMRQLNGIDVDELYSRVVFVDEPAHLNNVDFANVTANNLVSSKINNKLFNEYLVELNQIHLIDALNKLEIKGNASINKIDGVIQINNVNMPAIVDKMGNEENEPIQGNIHFDGKVRIKELFVRQMNDINMPDLLDQLYYRVWPQNITAKHTFKYLHAPNVFTPQINNVKTTHLININAKQPQLLKIEHGLRLMNAKFRRSLFTNFTQCDVNAAISCIHNVPKRIWNSVVVDNITLTENENPFSRLLNNAVHTKKDNIIVAPASLNHVYAESVFLFNRKQINGIDLQQIVNDALMYNATDQVITGIKEFTKLSVDAVAIEGVAQIPIVNEIDVSKVDASIIDKNNVNGVLIEGRKTFFGGMQTDHLQAPVASGVAPENLVSLTNLQPIPKVTIDDLTVSNNLDIEIVNNLNFSQFLDDRLLLDAGHDQIATANYYFDAIQLKGKTTIPTINEIALDDVVFDDGLQIINATKKFTQRFEVQGDAIIDVLNGFPVSDFYQQSIILQEEAHILGNVNLLAPSQVSGEIQTKSINGVPFDHINELLQSDNHRIRTEIIHDALHEIEKLVSTNTDMLRRLPHQYLYLEKAHALQIELEHTIGAQVEQKKDSVMLHIHTGEPGNTCGLPDDCMCPNQQTIKLHSSSSWNYIDNKYAQRIYSFEDYGAIINVITNSRSQSNVCKSNATQEYTSVTWYTFPGGNATGNKYSFPEHITGYISDVKFFSVDGHVYVLLAKLYDASHDTNVLDSLVLRLAKNMSQVEQVQKIRTNGAATLHVFHTAQGVNLVIGNVGGQMYEGTLTTDIFTFNREIKMFELLRSVPSSGCTSATSVVLDIDSLIILAQANSPLQVLKYNPFYKTYYFHESFLHDTTVSSVSVFYTGDFGISDAYLTAVTEKGQFYVYSYHYLFGWKLESDEYLEGLSALIPLQIGKEQYLFAPSSTTKSSLLSVVKQGL